MNTPLQPTGACRTMITPEEALELVIQAASLRGPQTVPLASARGLSLAEAIVADRDYPPFPRAMMDGFAVRVADAGKSVPVAGEIPAGCVWQGELVSGQCLEILTGAPCPSGTDAVVQKEHVERRGIQALLPGRIEWGQNIARQGSECRAGQQVLAAGEIIGPLAIAMMASFGITMVKVVPRTCVGVITTGGELVLPGQQPKPGQIRDSNGPMLVAMACELGIEHPQLLHAADSRELIVHAVDQMADMDIVLLAGGVSVGTYDLVPEALADCGAELLFHKVKQKPGKPLLLARKNRQLFFGLPGNPLACHLGFHRYVAAAIRQMSGRPAAPRQFQGELIQPIKAKGSRTHFVLARAEYAGSAAAWRIAVLPSVSSADLFGSCRANCYVEAPPGHGIVAAGEILSFTWLGHGPCAD